LLLFDPRAKKRVDGGLESYASKQQQDFQQRERNQMIPEWVNSGNLTAVGTLIVGSAGGYWFARSRDIRMDFNAAADPIRAALRKERADIRVETGKTTVDDLMTVSDRLWRWQRPGFLAAVEQYKHCHGDTNWIKDEIGQPAYADTKIVAASIDRLLAYMRRR
jgi:hypothetical protein